MEIRSSLPAVHARRQMNIANEKLQKASERLSSGYRVNSAADDTAGLAVSEKLRSQMKGLKQAARNCQDGINLVQTFEGALNETDSILQRCKELAAESANGEYNDPVDRKALQLEYDQLVEEINQISDTDFNGVFMLNGNPTIQYVDVEVQTPVESESFSPVYDENGNPTLDVESYRLNADYSGSPFGSNGMVAPIYDLDGMLIHTTYYDGDTETIDLSIEGFVTNADGTETRQDLAFCTYDDSNNTVEGPEFSQENNGNGDTIFISSQRLVGKVAPIVILELITKVTQKTEYLMKGNGSPALDANGLPVPISKQLETTFEIKTAHDSASEYTIKNMSMVMRSDTVWADGRNPNFSAGDENERYYTSDTNNGSINREVVYESPFAIDSFSSYYFDLHDPRFNGVSNKIVLDKGEFGPDRLKLGNFGSSLDFDSIGEIETGRNADVAYTLAWEKKEPDGDTFRFNAGSRGLTNSNGDTNIWPKPEIDYITEIVTNAITKYNGDVDLVIQTGTRTKDSVQFNFEYELRDTGDLKPDLNCSSAGLGLDKLAIGTQTDANSVIDMIDHALNKVSMVRAGFGAAQNRLAHKINDLTNTNENITAAESGIRDADMATEYSDYTKAQIVSNAAQSMLAQTMQLPRSILSLIS